MSMDATDQAMLGTNLIAALGGPAVVGGLLLGLLKRSMSRIDGEQSTKFEGMADKFQLVAQEMKESNRLQESALQDIKTRLAVFEIQSATISRAVEEFRAMDKAVTLLQSKVDASFRVIDDMKSRVDRFDSRIDRLDSELAGIREILRRVA